ncbi:hypothetical protein ACFLY2_02810 [Patescibacteria group bacterium]
MNFILNNITISDEFKTVIFEVIKENYNNEFETRIKTYENINRTIESEERKIKKSVNLVAKRKI